ncbi:hypothetical protein [Noviherbaspirillum sedimenti]|uniref:PH domain-containing protein n=1 Tax=Noviherbaspirillum sedimenti TaxID=2320865 RepID=A0A3A3G6V3_9BURK|nr:hypothetical protein [Noviherbaspirillum sedimenti]RJG02469.1 hypothetical protein D3878_13510 [Noviherbaspirillum sedimenti]
MTLPWYQPEKAVSGPAYSLWFKLMATVLSFGLAAYGLSVALRFPLLQLGWGVKLLLLGAALMLGVSYYWFLKARTTIDEKGIRQTSLYTKQVAWSDVRGVKMLSIPYAGWIFPPRLAVRTGTAFMTFNGCTQDVLIEFAKIALAYQNTR